MTATAGQIGQRPGRGGHGGRRGLSTLSTLVVLIGAILSLGATQPISVDAENRRCLNCHGQAHIATLDPFERRLMIGLSDRDAPLRADEPATRPSLYLTFDAISRAHASLACVDCHPTARDLPHAQQLEPATCSSRGCHADDHAAFLRGAHADAALHGNGPAPTCASCHGGHDILPKRDRRARIHPLNIAHTCGECHSKHTSATPMGHDPVEHLTQYLESVHGAALMHGGLAVAATCADCHGYHEVHPGNDPRSLVYRDHIPATCGRCHVGVVETFARSIHAQVNATGSDSGLLAPVCTDCHTAHAITRTGVPKFMLDIVNECGECHDDPALSGTRRATFYRTYRLGYHGKMTQLGSTRAARCSDCHGAHDILPVDHPQSRLHPDHRIATCGMCHPGANANFVLYDPHADYRDRERYPLLYAVWLYFIIVIGTTFAFFGLHSLLWFGRTAINRIRRGSLPHFAGIPHAVRRFSRINRVNHALVIISFFGLTLTGIPLFFSERPWAHLLAGVFGGIDAAGVWHRIFAVMLIFNFVLHAVGLVRQARLMLRESEGDGASRSALRRLVRWLFGPHSLMPRWRDVTDCARMFRYFITGRGKPAFGRWTYWEKFDYWADVIGTAIIGGSGLLLWFPAFFSLFMPGWFFNVASIIHGYEALLAIGFIFTIHFFNAHLRLEKFPVDDVIFTGRIAEKELEHERPEEYALLLESGRIEQLRTTPAPRWQRSAAILVGTVAMTIGFGMVVLIVLAGLEAL